MHCPYCETLLTEESPACHSCGLSLDKADHYFGAVPRLQEGITDLAGILSGSRRKAVRIAAHEFGLQFPQCHLDVVIAALPKELPLPAWTWWIFNRGRARDALRRGGGNRDLLLAVETTTKRACVTLGYGLEPFVSREKLAAVLDAGGEALAAGRYHTAALKIIAALRAEFISLLRELPDLYGAPEKTWPEDAEVIPAMPRPETVPVIAGY